MLKAFSRGRAVTNHRRDDQLNSRLCHEGDVVDEMKVALTIALSSLNFKCMFYLRP